MKKLWALTALASVLAVGAYADDEKWKAADDQPDGKGNKTNNPLPQFARPNGGAAANGISYHGGPVMTAPVNVYYIWYGAWSGNTATTLLTNLAQKIGGTGYWNINSTYTNSSSQHVSSVVNYVKSVNDSYSLGASLSDANVRSIVVNAINSGGLPRDPNGVYFVLASADVNETSGFCTQYCGWHTRTSLSGSDIKYAFIGNPARCPSSCAAQSTSPNGNLGADGMASILTHELDEAASDPDLNAWYDSRGNENADKCAWTFGTTSTAANGSKYNITLGTTRYLIQQNWVNASGGHCAMTF